jgi:hypothetical protein
MTTACNVLSMASLVLTLLGASVIACYACVVLMRTSDTSPRAWARNLADKARGRARNLADKARGRLGRPVHRDAHLGAAGNLAATATPVASAWFGRVTQGPIDESLLPIYRELDAILLRAEKSDAKAGDIQRDGEQFKRDIKDKWATDRANTRRQAKIAVIGAVLTITGIVLRIMEFFLCG